MRFIFSSGILALGCSVLAGCSSENESTGSNDSVAVRLVSADPACASQRAEVPRSAAVSRTIVADGAQVARNENTGPYVAYTMTTHDTTLYLSFAPTLPTSFSTAEAHAAFDYAYVNFDYEQPREYGGSLTFLSSNELLALSDFERFEVVDGALKFRLVRSSADHYSKLLSSYDDDDSNDPVDPETCTGGGDIQGLCACEFAGPPITVTLEGSFRE